MRTLTVIIGIALAASSASCTAQTEPAAPAPSLPPRSTAAAQVHDRWVSCAGEPSVTYDDRTADDAITLPLLDAAFQPVAAVVCDRGADPSAAVEKQAQDVTALVAALRGPDQPLPTPDGDTVYGCTMAKIHVPWLALLDAGGRWVRPGLPRDYCGSVNGEVIEQIRALT
ncbi:hypothetical protein ACTI_67050 [Actinoplanes sp. OR16]|uniref:hypothetical protein n=1 Tax=Actinoplanes sp. OR16 TaxID=946334 RepID=UPI000F71370B|nr:hypothetical protein [Actinoplanes sp. OR16]BBH70020.1 hypothetical protein ACTI_67050 [Actinoplanes sp. OR16]